MQPLNSTRIILGSSRLRLQQASLIDMNGLTLEERMGLSPRSIWSKILSSIFKTLHRPALMTPIQLHRREMQLSIQ